ncbi:MAG TPA: hypothetical protein VK704_03525 [Acidimicrobiales bacterium]|jgi:hypothetical protein|nr:hypothetical protein [Acidimicrobiales bacterium]
MKKVFNWVTAGIVAFGRFWWDFLVGDTPEITVAVLLVIGVVALARDSAHLNGLADFALPVLVVAGLTLSLVRARRRMKS